MNYEEEDYDYYEEEEQIVNIVLPQPHAGQLAVLKSKARFKVLCCGRRWGKTLVSQIVAISSMLNGEAIAYVTPEFSLGKDFFREILKYLPDAIIKTNNKSDLYIELTTGGSLKFFSGQSLDAFRGRKYHKVIIDEAAFISDLENAWYSAIRPTLSDYQGEAIFISTPKGKNFFYALFVKGKEKTGEIESFHFPSDNNPYFPKAEFESARKSLPSSKFNEEYLAIPGENSGGAFKSDEVLKNTIKELSDKPTVVYGIDLAKSIDYSVIIGLDEEGVMTYFDRWQTSHMDNMERIKRLPSSIMKVMDSTGIGDPIYEQLSYEVMNLHSFKFTSTSKPKIIIQLQTDVEQGNVKFIEKVADEMNVFEQYETATGYIKYEAMAGFHDDCVMALAMANYYRKRAFNIANWKLYTI